MTETDKVFAGSIPALYDRHLGPLLFEPYARDLAGRLAGLEGHVLETAAGTGIVTRALAQALPGSAITATDLNQPMLDHATRSVGAPHITWRQADAQALPFENASFDAVVCQFGVMFFPDKAAGFAEASRVLRPSGRFLFNVWDRVEENEIPAAVNEALATLFPHDPPRFMARTPHGYHDTDRIRDALRAAGFRRVEVETVTLRTQAASPRDPATGFCQGTPLRHEIEARATGRLDEVTEHVAQALAQRFGAGPIEGRLQAHVVSAFV
ncbi:MAG TPA: class I SAM-dependent methyltransferase [Azospirillaceae bacterium]|nr:class I SAM-dependent methyltransferase [Azospirillaceae bacterium]